MPIALDNLDWMSFNVSLAIAGVVFGWIYYYLNNKLSYIFLPLWILFLPNTIYLLTDIEHFIAQLPKVSGQEEQIIILQYIVLFIIGIVSYLLAMRPLSKFFKAIRIDPTGDLALAIIAILNFAIGLALVLGKFQRTHSWYVFTDPLVVVSDVLEIFYTPNLLAMFFFCGLITNLVYLIYHFTLVRSNSKKHKKR